MKGVLLSALRGMSDVASRLRPNAASRPPDQRSVLDDIAMRRPWNLRVKAARLAARTRISRLVPGITVIVVNWNTRDVTADVLRAVQRFSPPDTRILLIDNGSTDGSRALFETWPGIDTMLLRSNAGHGVALDLGVCRVRTQIAVTLDSDAIPLGDGWLKPAVEPLMEGRAVIAGLRSRRNFVHPVYLAVDTATFVRRKLSFQVHVVPGTPSDQVRWGTNAWDTGELMIRRFKPDEVVFVEKTRNPAEGLPGMTCGDVVYHHGGVSRDSGGGVTAEALQAWRQACAAVGVSVAAESDRA